MAITRKFIDAVIRKGWQPYIASQWMEIARGKAGAVITFHEHETFEYRWSSTTARILSAVNTRQEVK